MKEDKALLQYYHFCFVDSDSVYRVVDHLLRHDANPSLRDHNGFNAVHYAALNGHKLALEMVIVRQ